MKRTVVAALLLLFVTGPAQLDPGPERVGRIYDAYEQQLRTRMDQHFHDGEYEACVGILRILAMQHPDDPDIMNDLVYMIGNVGRHAEALATAIEFRRAHFANPYAVQIEANIYINPTIKLYERIPAVLEPVVQESRFLQTFVALGRAYEEMGLLKEAIRIHRLRLERFPNDQSSNVVRNKIAQLEARIRG
jgi:tetratricopeptide (TPR) repeat protein